MQTKIITTTKEFHDMREEWETLQAKDPSISYYSTYEYVKAWWDVYKEDKNKQLFIICVYQGKDIVGIAPLYITRRKKVFISWTELRFMGIGDYFGFIIDESKKNSQTIIKKIFDCINENSHKWDRLILTHIEKNSSLATYLFKSPVYYNNFNLLVEIPLLKIEKNKTFTDFEKDMPKKTRKYRNKLNREVGYKFKVIDNIDEKLYSRITEVHTKEQSYLIKYKNRKDRRALFEDEKRNKYLKSIICNNPKAIAFVLESNEGEIISYNLAYLHNNKLYSWNSAYNPKYADYRVTKVRYYEVFKFLYQNRIASTFDFGAGRYPWKFEWTNTFTSVYKLDFYREPSIKFKLLKALQMMKTIL